MTDCKMCEKCMTNINYRSSIKKQSESMHSELSEHWSVEPCMFEVGMDPDRETHLTLEESIESNFWFTDDIIDLESLRE